LSITAWSSRRNATVGQRHGGELLGSSVPWIKPS
jgi:hypothetical protein